MFSEVENDQLRDKPRPSDLVAQQPLGEAVEFGRGRIARDGIAVLAVALNVVFAVARCTGE